jgi:hypothetical protein
MAIPRFGFLKIEALACLLMVAAGIAGLVAALTGWTNDWLADLRWSRWLLPHVSIFWLVPQSLAVVAGGIGAWHSKSFTLAALGVASSLIVLTPVGCISFLPGVLMLVLIVARLGAFPDFLPRWRGPGPPPPGAWGTGRFNRTR